MSLKVNTSAGRRHVKHSGRDILIKGKHFRWL